MPEASRQILGMPESEGLGRGGLQIHVAYATCGRKRGRCLRGSLNEERGDRMTGRPCALGGLAEAYWPITR